MQFNDYQREAIKTAIYPEKYRLLYPTMGLAGEAGELANKVKKFMRDRSDMEVYTADRHGLAAELGDILWYVAAVATDIGLSLDDVAQGNLAKLATRAERNTISGSGDER